MILAATIESNHLRNSYHITFGNEFFRYVCQCFTAQFHRFVQVVGIEPNANHRAGAASTHGLAFHRERIKVHHHSIARFDGNKPVAHLPVNGILVRVVGRGDVAVLQAGDIFAASCKSESFI